MESVRLLLEHGASVNPSLTALTASPLHEACIRGETREQSVDQIVINCAALSACVTQRHIYSVIGVTMRTEEQCVLVRSASAHAHYKPLLGCLHILGTGSAECVKLILSNGALLEAFDIHFGTPLHAACAKAHLECAIQLLNAGEKEKDEDSYRLFTECFIICYTTMMLNSLF